MISTSKVVCVLAGGFLLCMGLTTAGYASGAVSATDEMRTDQSDRGQRSEADQAILRLSTPTPWHDTDGGG